MKILVQVCCAVDSHYFLKKLKEDFDYADIIAYFYDPNIHPYSEYKLRFLDVKRSCKLLDIVLIEGEYEYELWLRSVKGYENEPEKGNRCTICFEKRMENTIQKALTLNCTHFTTTLLMSPKKSQEKLQKIGTTLQNRYKIEFIFKDYRINNGNMKQNILAKRDKLYRQDYCGCIFGLTQQRKYQNIFMDEMISSINKQILPASIEEKIELHNKKIQLLKNNKEFKIIKKQFLNYRLLNGFVKYKNNIIASYFLPYSTVKIKKTKGKVEVIKNNIHYLNKNAIKLIDINFFNKLTNKNYNNVKELYFNPLDFKEELSVRNNLVDIFDLSTIIILDKIPSENIEIYLDSIIYNDTKDELLTRIIQ